MKSCRIHFSKIAFFKIAILIGVMVFGSVSSTVAFAAEPAFEAYYKFFLGSQHSGYVVQRFTIDDAKKEMTSVYYAYVKTPSGSTTESLAAKADMNFEPISFQYSALVDGAAKAADGTFKNKVGQIRTISGGKEKKTTLKVPDNGFLSTFLNYVMLKNGLMKGKSYSFFALSEEDPAFHQGSATIKGEEEFKGLSSFTVDISYKGIQFTGFIGPKGETLGSLSPMQNAGTSLVATKEEAVASFPFNLKHIQSLFGDIPTGKKNPLVAQKPTQKALAPKTSHELKSSPVKKEDPTTAEGK